MSSFAEGRGSERTGGSELSVLHRVMNGHRREVGKRVVVPLRKDIGTFVHKALYFRVPGIIEAASGLHENGPNTFAGIPPVVSRLMLPKSVKFMDDEEKASNPHSFIGRKVMVDEAKDMVLVEGAAAHDYSPRMSRDRTIDRVVKRVDLQIAEDALRVALPEAMAGEPPVQSCSEEAERDPG